MGDFSQLLYNLTLPDNSIRRAAEQTFEQLRSQPDQVLSLLAEAVVARSTLPAPSRQMALLLLKNASTIKDERTLLIACQPETREKVKAALMDCIANENEPALRGTVVLTTTVVAALLVPMQQWNEFLPFIFTNAMPPHPEQVRKFCINAISSLSMDLEALILSHLSDFISIVEVGLNDTQHKAVQTAALEACAAIFAMCEPGQTRDRALQLLPIMLKVIHTALSGPAHEQDEQGARDGLNAFISLAETETASLKPIAEPLVQACLAIGSEFDQLEDSTRRTGLQVILSICENRSGIVRHVPGALDKLVELLLTYMIENVDNTCTLEEWEVAANQEGLEDEDYMIGEESIDRLVIWLKGHRVVPLVYGKLQALFESPDWRARHAALMCFSATAEGAKKFIEADFASIVQTTLSFIANDANVRVRWAGVTCIGQLAIDWAPKIQQRHYKEIVTTFINRIAAEPSWRCRSRLCGSLINVNEKASQQSVTELAKEQLLVLVQLLTQPESPIMARESAITAIASVAGIMKEAFEPFVDEVTPILWQLLASTEGRPDLIQLKGKCIEALSLIVGCCVGPDRVGEDARKLMQAVVSFDVSKAADGDKFTSFLAAACSRMAAVMGERFVPYLPVAMKTALRHAAADIKPTIEQVEGDRAHSFSDQSIEYDQEGWDYVVHGSTRIGVHTAALAEKAASLNNICCYAEDLGPYFAHFVASTAELVLPMVAFKYAVTVREAAASCVPYLLRSAGLYTRMVEENPAAALAGAEQVTRVFTLQLAISSIACLVENIEEVMGREEEDLELETVFLAALQETILFAGETIGRGTDSPTPKRGAFLSSSHLNHLIELMARLLSAVAQREHDRMTGNASTVVDLGYGAGYDSDDEDQAEEMRAMDNDLLSQVNMVLQYLFECHGSSVTGMFLQKLYEPLIAKLVLPPSPAFLRQPTLCMFIDAFECGNAKGQMNHTVGLFVTATHQALKCEDSEALQQAAIYASGTLAEVMAESDFAPLAPTMIEAMERHAVKSEENIHCAENAVSALGKILLNKPRQVPDFPALISRWLSLQPVQNDELESVSCTNTIAHYLTNDPSAILGKNSENAPQVARIVDFALSKENFVRADARPCLQAYIDSPLGRSLIQ